ncbi:MAG: hypothetical protein AAGI11_19760 [Pseudomonadota bacterium]
MSLREALAGAELVQNLRKSSTTLTGVLCTVGGLVADVLQPIAPFANYLLYGSVAVLALAGVIYLRGRKEALTGVAMAGIATAVFGLLSLLQSGEQAQESGVIAATIPAVEGLQQNLGIIEAKIDDIKSDTEAIRASNERLEDTTQAVLESLDALRGSFGRGGIIANPSSPEQHYHNARIHELGGDYSAARRSYLEYFKADLPLLDPHLRFIDFLKIQEGSAGARETYNTLTSGSTSPMPGYARLLLLGPNKRKAALQSYQDDHPEFAPVFYHLSLEFSERRLGSQTLGQKRRELAQLMWFGAADKKGGLLKFMLDQELVGEWREDAANRLAALQSPATRKQLKNPVALSWMANNAGWNGNVQIGEPALEIRWNIKGQGKPVSTGASGYVDPNSGEPAPRAYFSLPSSQKATTVMVRYTDLAGEEQGPFEFEFKPAKETVDGNRRTLEATETSWIAFRDMGSDRLLYFTHLMTYRGAIDEIRYGLNRAKPNRSFDFPAWNQSGLAAINARTPLYIKVPRSTDYATVQLTYKNGDKSRIVRVDR